MKLKIKILLLAPLLFLFAVALPVHAAQKKAAISSPLKGKKVIATELISRADLFRIPLADFNLKDGKDSDGDGLSDDIEYAFGANPLKKSTNNNGYDDKTNLLHSYDPITAGNHKLPLDAQFAENKKSKELIEKGSGSNMWAWYVNPSDAKLYFLGNSKVAAKISKKYGLVANAQALQKKIGDDHANDVKKIIDDFHNTTAAETNTQSKTYNNTSFHYSMEYPPEYSYDDTETRKNIPAVGVQQRTKFLFQGKKVADVTVVSPAFAKDMLAIEKTSPEIKAEIFKIQDKEFLQLTHTGKNFYISTYITGQSYTYVIQYTGVPADVSLFNAMTKSFNILP